MAISRLQAWLRRSSHRFFITGLLLIGLFASGGAQASHTGKTIQVVATFSVLANMVQVIGGDQVAVTMLVEPGGDVHNFEPSPGSVQALAQAQILVSNGLGFETWLARLVQSSGFKGKHIIASKNVKPLPLPESEAHHHEAANSNHSHFDPHAWHSLDNGKHYAQAIAEGLSQADPAHASYYSKRLKHFLGRINELEHRLKEALQTIPASARTAVIAHDALGYFSQAYGIKFLAVAALSSQAEPSAKDLALLVDQIRKLGQVGLFTESGGHSRLLEQLAKDTQAPLGGPLYIDTLAPEGEPGGSYLSMFHWNAGQLIATLQAAAEPDKPVVKPMICLP